MDTCHPGGRPSRAGARCARRDTNSGREQSLEGRPPAPRGTNMTTGRRRPARRRGSRAPSTPASTAAPHPQATPPALSEPRVARVPRRRSFHVCRPCGCSPTTPDQLSIASPPRFSRLSRHGCAVSLIHSRVLLFLGFPGGSVLKSPPASAEGVGSIPGSGRCPGEGKGNPPQYSCLEDPIDRGAWGLHSIGSPRVGHN